MVLALVRRGCRILRRDVRRYCLVILLMIVAVVCRIRRIRLRPCLSLWLSAEGEVPTISLISKIWCVSSWVVVRIVVVGGVSVPTL